MSGCLDHPRVHPRPPSDACSLNMRSTRVWHLPAHAWFQKAPLSFPCSWPSFLPDTLSGPLWWAVRSPLRLDRKLPQIAWNGVGEGNQGMNRTKDEPNCQGLFPEWAQKQLILQEKDISSGCYLKTSLSNFTLLSGYLFVFVSSKKARAYASGPALTWMKNKDSKLVMKKMPIIFSFSWHLLKMMLEWVGYDLCPPWT